MDARRSFPILLAIGCLCSLGASHRTQHFLVSASNPQFARQVAEAAERYRHDLALEWLGKELPPWRDICPITVSDSPHMGAGGVTSFMFHPDGMPYGWRMSIQGSQQRILDSVLPHEVTHTIFATHFGRPLPRWADEGACTTVEDSSEKDKQKRLLIEFLTTNRGIAFNRMFQMKEYPRDVLPLYAQGFSLARYLIAQGGKRKFIDYVGAGMESNNWTEATQSFYGFESLSDLQVTWLDWVRRGSPAVQPSTQLASTTISPRTAKSAPPRGSGAVALDSTWTSLADGRQEIQARTAAASGSWYARQRDLTQQQPNTIRANIQTATRPQPLGRPASATMQWDAGRRELVPEVYEATTQPGTTILR